MDDIEGLRSIMNGFGKLTKVLRESRINSWGINKDIGYIGGLRAGGW